MHRIYRQLCRDHKHMQQLLDAFERLLFELGRRERDPATLSLILDALDYISVYPDRWHHPVEDLVFERLLDKPIPNRDAVIATQAEHRRIAAATRHLNKLFYAVANDAAVVREKLLDAARHYLQLQREHMQRENCTVFPLMEKHLSAADWAAIEARLQLQRDALFNPGVKRMYEAIHASLVESGSPVAAIA
ncbi:hemerythrin domain-containing protein [Microbulbifer sp. SAOS-129_SWC]|uniref:hemerythrin domain-containing protein n=1 Tax=Microbulbifer sp. SAOS-129_SWC TaxID=3145235 RepID=UPI003217D07F